MKSELCLKCSSPNMVKNVHVSESGTDGGLLLHVVTNPKGFFTDPVSVKLSASMCADCGFTELYAENPQWIARAVEKAKKNS